MFANKNKNSSNSPLVKKNNLRKGFFRLFLSFGLFVLVITSGFFQVDLARFNISAKQSLQALANTDNVDPAMCPQGCPKSQGGLSMTCYSYMENFVIKRDNCIQGDRDLSQDDSGQKCTQYLNSKTVVQDAGLSIDKVCMCSYCPKSQTQIKADRLLENASKYRSEIQEAVTHAQQFSDEIGDNSLAQSALSDVLESDSRANELLGEINADVGLVDFENQAISRITQNAKTLEGLADMAYLSSQIVEAGSYVEQLEEKYLDMKESLIEAEEKENEIANLTSFSAELKIFDEKAKIIGSQLREIVKTAEQNLEIAKTAVEAENSTLAKSKFDAMKFLIEDGRSQAENLEQVYNEALAKKSELESDPDHYVNTSADYMVEIDKIYDLMESGEGNSGGAVARYTEINTNLESAIKKIESKMFELKGAEREAQKKNISKINEDLTTNREVAEVGLDQLEKLKIELQRGLAEIKIYINEITAYKEAAYKYKVKIDNAAQFKDIAALKDNLQALKDAVQAVTENYNLAKLLIDSLSKKPETIDRVRNMVVDLRSELEKCNNDAGCDNPAQQKCVAGSCANNKSPEGTIFKGQGTKEGLDVARESLAGSNISMSDNVVLVILGWVNFSLPFAGLLAFVGIVYAGFLYVANFGNEYQRN